MRSRYAAYALDKIDHIVATHDPANRDQIDENSAHQWARESTWLGLEVVATEGGHETDDTGMVEFIARYAVKGRDFAHHERALFQRKNGTWFYMDGHIVKPKPVVRPAPKVGRNEPCPCGSERKFKKCCGAAA